MRCFVSLLLSMLLIGCAQKGVRIEIGDPVLLGSVKICLDAKGIVYSNDPSRSDAIWIEMSSSQLEEIFGPVGEIGRSVIDGCEELKSNLVSVEPQPEGAG